MCDCEDPIMRRPLPTAGCCVKEGKNQSIFLEAREKF